MTWDEMHCKISNFKKVWSTSIKFWHLRSISFWIWEPPIAPWVNCCPADLTVPSSSPAQGKVSSTKNGVLLHTAFYHQLFMVLIWLNYCWKGQKLQVVHPFIHPSNIPYPQSSPYHPCVNFWLWLISCDV